MALARHTRETVVAEQSKHAEIEFVEQEPVK
jgi:hypothetical protein